MATKRKPLRRRQVGGEAEYQAWHETFECGSDGFHDLDEFGVFDPCGSIMPIAEKAAAKATFRAATEDAWKRFGDRFMAEWKPTHVRQTPWAFLELGAP
ncbi:hypothetical protein FJ960_01915 [Mesorhizobium sp. B2-3-11]|uniref:hypothetical protein n=1 Tax=Mesorhizobium sp. B2-3-11 TaxID=2589953 RepID=UPI00112EDD50|nr:hypothetical protein [Mesorhizobium sp. B2-3-11]TPM11523.1 hypothetical protein FJ960_01915 [Mesorhizobium sp. B2-3-11]